MVQEKNQLKIYKIFSETTYGDDVTVYTNDSLFCLYFKNNKIKVWKNGVLLNDNVAILPLIKEDKIFKKYRFQSEFM